MPPLTPHGKPLSQQRLDGTDFTSVAEAVKPITTANAFQWLSLAKAVWTWILRPLWYLMFKWPFQLMMIMRPKEDDAYWEQRRNADFHRQRRRHWQEEESRRR